MSNVRELHEKAMNLAEQAMIARYSGEIERAIALAQEAYPYEADAAELIPRKKESEPTRSILYRSAASLAYQGKALKECRRLITEGLSGFPPPEVEQELRNLLSQVKEYEGFCF